jgi:vacuolar-type H+-ATPase subunit I/STV1
MFSDTQNNSKQFKNNMANKTNQNKEAAAMQQADNRIAAVRDLIFGENIQQYNAEFADVYDKIKALKEESSRNLSEAVVELEGKLTDLERLMDDKFQDLNSDLDKRLAELDDAKADRVKLGQALEKIALMLQE